MNKIEEIEKELKHWKAARDKYKKAKVNWLWKRMVFKIEGLEAALEILKKPSNTQLKTDACSHEWRGCPKHWSWCRKCDVIDR